MEEISSVQNPRIKNIVKLLNKPRERKKQNLVLFEGARELSLALKANYLIDSIFVNRELFAKTEYPNVLDSLDQNLLFEVTQSVFEKIAYREGSDGLLIVAKAKEHSLANLKLSANPFVIVLEAVEKPGNLGAVLRTADAAKVDAVIICDPKTDIYNPNTIRSSVGCVFTVPIAVDTSREILSYLKKKNVTVFAAELTSSSWYHEADYTQPTAIIMGTEADGLTDFWLTQADQRIKIPMRGAIDSLNISVSTAVITFESMRQRGFK